MSNATEGAERETAINAIKAWRANPATTFTPANILREFGDAILTALSQSPGSAPLVPDVNAVRDDIARIIAPSDWRTFDRWVAQKGLSMGASFYRELWRKVEQGHLPTDVFAGQFSDFRQSLKKADQIAAAIRATPAAPVAGSEMLAALSKGFMTACSGDGEYQIKIGFESLKNMQDAHMALCKSAYADPRQQREGSR